MVMNMNVDVANKLLNLRKKYGYSQEELAEKLGISRQAVSKWERAEASPDTENLISLAKLYNVSLDEIFEIDVIKSETINSRKSVSLKKDFFKKSSSEEKDENIMRMQEPIYSQAQKIKVEEKYPTLQMEFSKYISLMNLNCFLSDNDVLHLIF